MSETAERVAVACPSCSPSERTVHEVLKVGGGRATVRCTQCGHVHKEEVPEDDAVEVQVVVSQEDESFTARVDVDSDETIARGDEFVVDTEEAIMEARVTDVQVGPENRVEEAAAEDVTTVWTRAIDNVAVKVTVNPKGGTGEESRSVTVYVPGDHEFVVGETESFGDEEFAVKAIHVREDAPEYRHGKLDREGDWAYARDVNRLYGVDRTTSAWSAW